MSRRRQRDRDHDDDEEELQYGIRQSRRATSFEYRDSSSLTPAQIMEQEVYYEAAEDALERGMHIAHLLVLLFCTYIHLSSTVTQWVSWGMM